MNSMKTLKTSAAPNKTLILSGVLLVCLVVGFMAISFSPRSQDSLTTETTTNTDTASLEKYFDLSKLPKPEKVQWIQQSATHKGIIAGPTDYSIVAVLSYNEPTAKFKSKLSALQPEEVYVSDDFVQAWMPDAVKESFSRTPENYLKYNSQAYSSKFLLKSPLSEGWIFFEDNSIVLFGATK